MTSLVTVEEPTTVVVQEISKTVVVESTEERIVVPESSVSVIRVAVQGPAGADGVGVPVGGTVGQVLTKLSSDDFDDEWADALSGADWRYFLWGPVSPVGHPYYDPPPTYPEVNSAAFLEVVVDPPDVLGIELWIFKDDVWSDTGVFLPSEDVTAEAIADAIIALNLGDIVTHDASEFDLAGAAADVATDLATESATRATQDALLIPLTQKAAASGVATLDGSGLIPTNQLPGLAISTVNVVGSQAAMLALTAQQGDFAIRTDLSKTFVLSTNSPGTLADWKELLTPADVVTSVDGRTGAVTLSDLYDAVGAAATAQAYAIQRGNHTGTQTSSTISDLTEAVQDVVGALTGFGGAGLTYTYDDTGNSVSLSVNVDDSSIEISSDTLRVKALGVTSAMLAGNIALSKLATDPLARANHTGTQLAATISDFTSAVISAGSGTYQPLDSDLTAIAALSTTSFGRSLLVLANQAALDALFASTFQPLDSDLTAIAALSTTSYGRAFLALADAAAGRTALGLGTAAVAATGDFDPAGAAASAQAASQPLDSDLTSMAALTTTTFGRSLLTLANQAAADALFAPTFQPLDSDLTAIAALTTTSYGRAFLALADAAAARTALALGTVATLNVDTDGTLAANSDIIVASQKAVKTYVDAVASGLSVKASCAFATAAALPSLLYSNGSSGVGATLTGVAVGALSVDGSVVVVNERILVKDQVAALQNGIYLVTAVGSGIATFVLTRVTDNDQAAEIPGAFTFIEAGTVNSGGGFVVASEGPFTMGTTAITWTQFSGAGEITAGTGLSKSGNTLSVATNGVTNALLAQVAANTIKSNATGSTADPSDLTMGASTIAARLASGTLKAATPAEIKTLLAIASTDVSGLGSLATLNTVGSALIDNDSIVNADINSAAAIAYSKLALTGAILNADLAGSIAYSKLSLANSIVSGDIVDGTVALADLANLAAKTVIMRHTNSTGVPEATTMANLLTDLSGQAGAAFSWNSQNQTSLGDLAWSDFTFSRLASLQMGATFGGAAGVFDLVSSIMTLRLGLGFAPYIDMFAIGDANTRMRLTTSSIGMGPGTTGLDVSLARSAAGIWTIAGGVILSGDATAATHLMNRQSSDARYAQLSIATTKGDILAATASATITRLAVSGTNYQALGADSSTATGLAYQASSKSVLTTAGDQIIATAANTPARLAIGTPGQAYLVDDSTGKIAWALDPIATSSYTKPTGSLAQTTIRAPHDGANVAAYLVSGRLSLIAINLAKGQVVTSISFLSATTALSVGSNQWFGIFDSSRVMKKVTGDDTSTAWAANSIKTLNLSSTHTATYTGLHYIGICVVATTVPALRANTNNVNLVGLAPILSGASDTGLTNPASCPSTATALSANANVPYAYVS